MLCYLHIGGEKTGSTSLQEFFDLNRKSLAKSGVLYTESSGRKNNRGLALLAYEPSRRDDYTGFLELHDDRSLAGYQEKIRHNLKEEIRRGREAGCGQVVFSSEHLQSRLKNIEDVNRLKNVLLQVGISEVVIVYYLRDPVQVAQSLYSTSIKSGCYMKEPPGPENTYYRHVCDHAGTVQRYTAVFGKGQFRARLFNRREMKNGSVIDDFLETTGIRLDGQVFYPEVLNKSLSGHGLKLLNLINRDLPERLSRETQLNLGSLVERFERHFAEPKYRFPENLQEAYRQAFAESNEFVRRTCFPDMETLFEPVVTPGESSDPADQQQDEAVAALVHEMWKATLVEGSGSSNLSSRTGNRVGRLIRRMKDWRKQP